MPIRAAAGERLIGHHSVQSQESFPESAKDRGVGKGRVASRVPELARSARLRRNVDLISTRMPRHFSNTVKTVIVAVVTACWPLPSCHGDSLLQFKTTSESFAGKQSETEYQIWIGESAARLDLSEGVSYIVDRTENRMLILDHARKVFNILALPVRLESYFEGEQASNYELVKTLLKPVVRLDTQGQPGVMGEWRTKLYSWSFAYSSTYEMEMKYWLTQDLKVDEDLFNDLLSSYYALSLNQWIDEVLETKGIAVRTEIITERYQGHRKTITVLESISELPPSQSQDRYRAPSSYEREDFDATRYAVIIESSQ